MRNLVLDVETAYWELYFSYRNFDTAVAGRNSALETWRRIHALYVVSADGGEADKEAQAREQYFLFRSTVETALKSLYETESQPPLHDGSGGDRRAADPARRRADHRQGHLRLGARRTPRPFAAASNSASSGGGSSSASWNWSPRRTTSCRGWTPWPATRWNGMGQNLTRLREQRRQPRGHRATPTRTCSTAITRVGSLESRPACPSVSARRCRASATPS